MAKSRVWRKVSVMPLKRIFKPVGVRSSNLEEIIISIDELEAMRLKDIEKLHQSNCADKMTVSRQTYQLILESGREKLTKALYTGRTIKIAGGKYIYNDKKCQCNQCGIEIIDEIYSDGICSNCKKQLR